MVIPLVTGMRVVPSAALGGSGSLSTRVGNRHPNSTGSTRSNHLHPLQQAAPSRFSTIHAAAATASALETEPWLQVSRPSAQDEEFPLGLRPPGSSQGRAGGSGTASGPHADGLPEELYQLLDPTLPVQLPAPGSLSTAALDNSKLDRLVAQLGRSKGSWRRALLLYEWLKDSGHALDDRLCTTLIRLCADHGDAVSALSVYEWMRAPRTAGGAALRPTAYTYTAAMRAALNASMVERALQIWSDAECAKLTPDCRMCITYIEACSRVGQVERALALYASMRSAPRGSPMAPTVHAYTAAMRAASEGGRWVRALDIWEDMKRAGCVPTGHAYAAVISACAAGGDWPRAVTLFEEMGGSGIRPDVVSCTALITALAAGGEADKAEAVVTWMLGNGLKPNVRTYTALLTAMGTAKQWARAVEMLYKMQLPEWGAVQPNSYTYSALLKFLGEHGQWQLAEAVFGALERQALGLPESPAATAATTATTTTVATAPGAVTGPGAQGPEAVPPALAAAGASAGQPGEGSRAWSSPSQLNGLNLNMWWQQQQQGEAAAAAAAGAGTGSGFSLFSASSSAPGSAAITLGPVGGTGTVLTVQRPAMRPGAAGSANAEPDVAAAPAAAAASVPTAVAVAPAPAKGSAAAAAAGCVINEVVCGALMLAYERAGMWSEACGVLARARTLGLRPNTVMYNTAISAAGKAGQLEVAERLFEAVEAPDTVTHETLLAAYGVCGLPQKAEGVFRTMVRRGFKPRDYAYCGLVAAYSLSGDHESALAVRWRMRRDGATPSVHVYNALLAACERARLADKALELLAAMKRDGVEPNAVTQQLMMAVGRQGVETVESQQVAFAALSAAFAAAGSILIQRGMF